MSTVVAQPYSTAGNGGRKLVRLNDGTLITALRETASSYQIKTYKSEDNGNTWALIASTPTESLTTWALVSLGNKIGLIYNNSGRVIYLTYDKNGGAIYNTLVESAVQRSINSVSLAIDPTNGHLHACWSSKNSTYPNSFNIRYSKSTDGGVTWSAVEQITDISDNDTNYNNPTIVVIDRIPTIIFSSNSTYSGSSIYSYTKRSLAWTGSMVYDGLLYTQSSPSAVVDKDGVIHVAWGGTDSGDNNTHIRYSKSADGGVAWSAMSKLTSGDNKVATAPSISVDKNGTILILFGWLDTSYSLYSYNLGRLTFNGSWSGVSRITKINTSGRNITNPSVLYDETFSGEFGITPPTIYQSYNSVEYIGTYTANNAPTLTLTDSNAQPITQDQTIKHTNKTPFLFRILANDSDENDNLEYRILLRNVEYRAWTGITKGVETEISIPSDDLLLGNNTVDVFVRDGNGGEVSSSFILRNLTPESYSQKHVYDLIVGWM